MSDWSPVKPVTPEVKHICLEMKAKIEKMAGGNFEVYVPVDFTFKDEGAINYTYVAKVEVGANVCVHAMIFKAGGGELNVEGTRYPKTHSDPLIPF